MNALRRLAARQRWIAALLVAAALAVRVLVPAGYMPARPGSLALTICSGHMLAAGMAIAMPSMAKADHGGRHGDDDRSDQPCPFAGLAMPGLAGADQPVLAALSALPPSAGVDRLPGARAPPRRAFLRPPLRAPPALG